MCIPIRQYMPPLISHLAWDLFKPEECDKIKKIGELREFTKAKMGSPGKTHEDSAYRDTDVSWIQPDEKNIWMFHRIDELVAYLNFTHFQKQLVCFDQFQYSKYKEGGHYKYHSDVIPNPQNGLFRKLSIVVMLSDEDEYEGGVFNFIPHGNVDDPVRVKLKKGQILIFDSTMIHKVEPVTKGKRITLVTWALGEKPQ